MQTFLKFLRGFTEGVVLLGLLFGTLGAQEKPNTCLECHSMLEGSLQIPPQKWNADIHKTKGLGCADCHGGDPTQMDDQKAMNRAKGFVGAPQGAALVQMCGKCHSDAAFMKKYNPSLRVDQVSEYFTSVHGKRLKTGDQNVATCISCHGVHEIRPVSDPRARVYPTNVADTCGACHSNDKLMAPYKIKTHQKEEYQLSVHYEALMKKGDLSAPTCNSCHGNHGAAPPGVGSVTNVCGQCHSVFADLFNKSPHKAAFNQMGLPACVYCHGNHGIKHPEDTLLGVDDKTLCSQCHTSGDPGFQQAQTMRQAIDQLKNSIASSEAVLSEAEHKGMEVSQPVYDLIEARQDLTKARTQVHAFNAASLQVFVQAGLNITHRATEKGHQALAEYQFRRKGLAISLVVILIVIVGLYFKIRQVDRRSNGE
ncbi:MAG: cytochrome c3 family protein [Acidobacteriia bacterium]|nr:cytochrome c3 family protein [Terriglobia bacterium]